MDSVDLEVVKTVARWVESGRRAILVTVVKTWGSSPRPEGAMLAIRDDGLVVGSVSGGCIEDDLIHRVREHGIEDNTPQVVRYGVTAEEARRVGLPCGGTIELAIEPLDSESGIVELRDRIVNGELVVRTVDMETGRAQIERSFGQDEGVEFDGRLLRSVHGPRYRMLVIGAGQLSRYLCEIALGLDYRVTVCDPREEYADEWDPPGVELVRTMPDDMVIEMAPDNRTAVIALTHDPKLDDLALMEALKTPAFYVGAIGSRRNSTARRERLRLFDVTEEELAKLRGPAGIYIGSRTPPEIALSILAEITAAKNGVALPSRSSIATAKISRERLQPRHVSLDTSIV
ncbi:XdhC family protein [Paraburkholderia sp. 22B1P]|uniref:XdhC family protein n=1 Tax=Paraburkholderia sp. 22B1P TaxID=3080498 RepID=UPI00308EBC6E|nr:XdhC family protein [Paraburkholderia sp. 22B1P]